jgi:hypothetical protein
MKVDDNERGPAEGDAGFVQENVEAYTVVQQSSEAQDAQAECGRGYPGAFSDPKPADVRGRPEDHRGHPAKERPPTTPPR